MPFTVISLVVGAWWLVVFLKHRSFRQLLEHGVIAQGVIMDIRKYKLFMAVKIQVRRPKFQYRFLTASGAEVMSAKKELPLLMRSREEQDVISITYLPEKPQVNHMTENLKMYMRGLSYWLCVPLVAWLVLVSPLLASTLLVH